MKMNEKLDIMLSRKRVKKGEFAERIGVTYRAFAYYMNGTRKPRRSVLDKIAAELNVTPEFLTDDTLDLELTSEETLLKKITDRGADSTEAANFLSRSRGLLAGNSLTDDDKQHLLRVLAEIYEDSRKRK